jgi:hypothetical protein
MCQASTCGTTRRSNLQQAHTAPHTTPQGKVRRCRKHRSTSLTMHSSNSLSRLRPYDNATQHLALQTALHRHCSLTVTCDGTEHTPRNSICCAQHNFVLLGLAPHHPAPRCSPQTQRVFKSATCSASLVCSERVPCAGVVCLTPRRISLAGAALLGGLQAPARRQAM